MVPNGAAVARPRRVNTVEMRGIVGRVRGVAPHHSYVWGGSGGGRRSPLCLENAADAFDGALPFMGGGNAVPFPATEKVKSGQPIAFACMFNRQRMLRRGDKPARVVDAMQPGGSGNPSEGLNRHAREELVYLDHGALYAWAGPATAEAIWAHSRHSRATRCWPDKTRYCRKSNGHRRRARPTRTALTCGFGVSFPAFGVADARPWIRPRCGFGSSAGPSCAR